MIGEKMKRGREEKKNLQKEERGKFDVCDIPLISARFRATCVKDVRRTRPDLSFCDSSDNPFQSLAGIIVRRICMLFRVDNIVVFSRFSSHLICLEQSWYY